MVEALTTSAPTEPAADPRIRPAPEGLSPVYRCGSVALYGPGYSPKVRGRWLRILTPRQYRVISALCEAGGFLTTYYLDQRAGLYEARKHIQRLRRDPAWAAVLPRGKYSGDGYKLR